MGISDMVSYIVALVCYFFKRQKASFGGSYGVELTLSGLNVLK